MSLSSDDWQALLTLSGELAELVDADPAGAAGHALDTLYRLTGAQEGFLVFSVLALVDAEGADPLRGWRPVHTYHPSRSEDRARLASAWYADPGRILADATSRALARTVGRPRAYLRRDLVSDAKWQREPVVDGLLRPLGVQDRLLGGTPVAPGVEVVLGLDRVGSRGAFGERERELARAAATHLGWFYRRLAAAEGLVGPSLPALSRREGETLRHLLAGHDERVVAEEMGLSTHTVHQYVKRLYPKFGVHNRAGLLARFVGAAVPRGQRSDAYSLVGAPRVVLGP